MVNNNEQISPVQRGIIVLILTLVLAVGLTEKVPIYELSKNQALQHKQENHVENPVYAYVHIAKTAGSEINGELAVHYERVCGNKGYSFDSYEFNQRNEEWAKQHTDSLLRPNEMGVIDSISKQPHYSNKNRGRVPLEIMKERGFEDCDWIGLEENFNIWEMIAEKVQPTPLEFHVPCRDPVDHLLSMANHHHEAFNCNITDDKIPSEVQRLAIGLNRFGMEEQLKKWEPSLIKGIAFKCFQPLPIQHYLDYMSSKLQFKRQQRPYIHRDTNLPRDKEKECLPKNDVLMRKVRDYMEKKIPLYQFCKSCIGSNDDLLMPHN